MKRAIITLVLLVVAAMAAGNLAQHRRYTASTAVFDISNDWMRLTSSGPTGLADGKNITVSGWFDLQGTDSSTQTWINFATSTPSTRFQVQRTSANFLNVFGRNASGTTILDITTDDDTLTAANGWVHLHICLNMADAGASKVYFNGVSQNYTGTFTDDTLDLVAGTNGRYSICSGSAGSPLADVAIAELWINDSFVAATSDFRTANARPKFLGANGSLPGGSQPVYYFRGAGNGFNVNSGTAANMTITGSLTEQTSP